MPIDPTMMAQLMGASMPSRVPQNYGTMLAPGLNGGALPPQAAQGMAMMQAAAPHQMPTAPMQRPGPMPPAAPMMPPQVPGASPFGQGVRPPGMTAPTAMPPQAQGSPMMNPLVMALLRAKLAQGMGGGLGGSGLGSGLGMGYPM